MSVTTPGRLRRSLALFLVVPFLLGALQTGGAAFAPGPADDTGVECVPEYVHAVGDVCRLPDGLYRMTFPDGHTRTTHGPDPAPESGDDDGDLTTGERRPHCTDTGHYQHVLYGHPTGSEDRGHIALESIRRTIRQMTWVLNEDALETGGVTADYKILCDDLGRIRVDTFTGTASSRFWDVVRAARSAGFDDGDVDYTIFWDGQQSGVCGVGHISGDERPGQENLNNRGGDYGVTYSNCWTGRTAMHENGHNQGAVQLGAPDSDGGWHCRKGADIMCYPPWRDVLRFCLDRVHFDCEHDSYFHADPEPGSYLDTHWNIGSRVNRFITFDRPVDTNEDPVAAVTITRSDNTVIVDGSGSSDPEGAPLIHAWAFGDGSPEVRGETAEHTYDEPGRYRLTLWVADGAGGLDKHTEEVLVHADVPERTEHVAFDGHVACSVTFLSVATNDRCAALGLDDASARQQFTFPVDVGVSGLRVAVVWDAADAGGAGLLGASEMRYQWQSPPGLGGGSGTAPLVQEDALDPASATAWQGGDLMIDVRPSGDDGLVKDQPFRVCIDILYGGAEAPATVDCA